MHPFTAAFIAAVLLATATQLWLGWRHMRHVVARRGAVPGEFRERIPLDAHQKAADYTVARTRVSLVETLVTALLAFGFTLGGGLEAISQAWSGTFTPGSYAHGIALLLSMALVSGAIDIPFSLYRTFRIEAAFGFNRMSLGLWLADFAKGTVLSLVIGVPLLWLVLWLMGAMGTHWWLYVWLAVMAFTLVANLVAPLIMLWFNKFSPLEDGALRTRIEGLLAKCGFRSKGLFVMDGSRRSTHGNAFFAGLGRTKRIVFFDTLLKGLSGEEIEAVLAHELGHFSRGHLWKRMAFMSLMSLALLWALAWLMDHAWFYASLGTSTETTAMALALFSVAAPHFTFILSPLFNQLSRRHEFEADAYAAAHAPAQDLVRALVKLYQDNAATLTPDPLHSAFYDSHPPASIRIARLNAAAA
jgi:STE24 endopeptidase